MEYATEDFATLQQHYERLWTLYAEFEQPRSVRLFMSF
jgi:hypothetical protein